MQAGNEDAARKKYYRDREKLMDLFGLARTKWVVRRYGEQFYAESELGNTIWSNSLRELEKTLIDAGVNPKDVKIEMR